MVVLSWPVQDRGVPTRLSWPDSPLGSPPAAGVWSRPLGQEQHRPRLHPHENTRRAPFVLHEDLPLLIGNSDPADSP